MALADHRPVGANITLLPCINTACNELDAKLAAEKLANQGVDIVFGDTCSGASVSAVSVTAPRKLLLFSAASTSPQLSAPDNYFFRTVPSDIFQGQFAAKVLIAAGVNSSAVVSGTSAYGLGLAYTFIAAYTQLGGRLALSEQSGAEFNAATTAQSIVAKNAGGVFIATNNVTAAAALLKALHDVGYKGFLLGGDSLSNPNLAMMAGPEAVEGMQTVDLSPGSAAFRAGFANFTGGKVTYSSKAANGYDAMTAYLDALEVAPEPKDSSQVQQALRGVVFKGQSGHIAFDQQGDLLPLNASDGTGPNISSLYTLQVFKGGKLFSLADGVPLSDPLPAAAPPPLATVGDTPPVSRLPSPPPPSLVPPLPAGTPKGSVLMGCILPTTGDNAGSGLAVQAGLQMAFAERKPANTSYTLLPCVNTQCDEVLSKVAATELAALGVSVIFGDTCSRATISALSVTGPAKLLLISASSSSPQLSEPDDYFYRTVPSDVYQGKYLAQLLWSRGVKSAAVVFSSTAYGLGLSYNFIADFTALGGSITTRVELAPFAPFDAAKAAANISASDPGGVFFAMINLGTAAEVMKALRSLGFKAPFFGGDAILSPTMIKLAGSVAEGLTGTDFALGSFDFIKRFANFTQGKIPVTGSAGTAYDAMTAYLSAREAAAAPKGSSQVAAALARSDFKGVTGRISFDANGDLVPASDLSLNYATLTIKDGKRVPVAPLPTGRKNVPIPAAGPAAASG